MTSGFRRAIFFVLLVGVAGAGYQFMVKPANQHLSVVRQRVDGKRAKLADFEEATAKAEDLNKQLGQLEEAITFFESKLPSTSEIHKVLEQVTVIAQKQGLQPKTIRTLSRKDNSGYVEQPLSMELVGNFNSFYSFLLEIEKLPRIMKLRELKLHKDMGGEGEVGVAFIVSIFFQNKAA
ncbi:MAG: type 4a pilus biogenesis protein PilO [Phycisphaerales bacterium]|nr:MAG: type 4a pilus biogenesis protein PilO [Phycisphaerales bacterium]